MKKGLFIIMILLALAVITSCAKTSPGTSGRTLSTKSVSMPNPMVHFNFDADEVIAGDRALIDENAEWMKRNSSAVIILEGHCDEIGPTEYNMELGDKRARTVKAHLIERGVSHDRIIMVVSYGDTKPLDPTHSNTAWRKNRRVEFIIR